MSDTGNALAVSAVAVDSQDRFLGLVENGQVRVSGDTTEGVASWDKNNPQQHVIVDDLGKLWTGHEQSLVG